MDLVKQLFLDDPLVDAAAGPFRLGENERPVRTDLADRKADRLEPVDVLEAWIGEVAAGHLRSAFEKMASHGRGGDAVIIPQIPAEMRRDGADGESGVGDTASDDDVGAFGERRGDLTGPQIGVRADNRFTRGTAAASRDASSSSAAAGDRSSPVTIAIRGARHPMRSASCAIASAAPSGSAAPKLPMMAIR